MVNGRVRLWMLTGGVYISPFADRNYGRIKKSLLFRSTSFQVYFKSDLRYGASLYWIMASMSACGVPEKIVAKLQ